MNVRTSVDCDNVILKDNNDLQVNLCTQSFYIYFIDLSLWFISSWGL